MVVSITKDSDEKPEANIVLSKTDPVIGLKFDDEGPVDLSSVGILFRINGYPEFNIDNGGVELKDPGTVRIDLSSIIDRIEIASFDLFASYQGQRVHVITGNIEVK